VIICLLFTLTIKEIFCQTKFYNGLQQTHGSLTLPSEVMRTLPVPANYSPRRTTSSNSFGSTINSKSGTQSAIVAIPLYIRNTSPSKTSMLYDILSASLAENAAKSRKSIDSKLRIGTLSSSKQTSEVPKYHSYFTSPSPQRYQSQQTTKYNIQEQNKSESPKQEQPKTEDFSDYGSNGYSSSQKHGTHTSSSSTYYSSPQQSNALQSDSKTMFPKSSVAQTLTQEDGQKHSYTEMASSSNGYGMIKLTDSQALYDANVGLSQNYDSGSYAEKTASKNTESSEYGSNDGSSSYVNTNIGSRDPYSMSNGLSYSASSISNPLYTISTNTGPSFGGRDSSYSNSGSGGYSYYPSYSSDSSNSDSVGSGSSGSMYSNAAAGSSGISEDGNHNSNYSPQTSISYSVTNANFDPQSASSSVSGKSHKSLSGLYGQQGISYTIPISFRGYNSGSVSTSSNNDNNNNNQVLSPHGIGYNSQAMSAISSSVYNPNSQAVSSITLNPNYQSISSTIYNPNSQLISSSIYNPSSQSLSSNNYNPSSQSISTHSPSSQLISSGIYNPKSQTISSNTYNPNSQSISTNNYNSNSQTLSNSGSNGYGSNSNDYSSLDEVDCYDDKSSSSADLTGSSVSSETEKQSENPKSNIYTVPTQTSGLRSYETDDLDPSKLDLKIVHLPVSLLKRLVGNGELALPSFH